VSGAAVILPSFLLLVLLSHVYFRFGHMQAANTFFMGFIPAVAAVILTAAWNMTVKTVKGVPEAVIALASAVLLLSKGGFLVNLLIILTSAIAGYQRFRTRSFPSPPKGDKTSGPDSGENHAKAGIQGITSAVVFSMTSFAIQTTSVIKLFTTFAGMSVLLFGGGYVFIPLIQQTVVESYGWVTRQEFIDAIALGQVTPGPILISAAFIGYKVAGFSGAAAATIGIFTPPALIMLLATRFMDKIKGSDGIKAGMRGIRSAVLGMIAAAGLTVGFSAPMHWSSFLIFSVTLLALVRFKIETVWVIPTAGLAGLLLY
jgi:chromate transporter